MSWGIRSCYLDRRTDGLVYHKQSEKKKSALFLAFFDINKQKQRALFIKATETKRNEELCLQNQKNKELRLPKMSPCHNFPHSTHTESRARLAPQVAVFLIEKKILVCFGLFLFLFL